MELQIPLWMPFDGTGRVGQEFWGLAVVVVVVFVLQVGTDADHCFSLLRQTIRDEPYRV